MPRHTFQFTPKTLRNLLTKVGFVDIKITQELNPGHITLSIQNWLQKNVPDLRNNPSLHRGRSAYYTWLSLFLIPLNYINKIFGVSGVMKFQGKVP